MPIRPRSPAARQPASRRHAPKMPRELKDACLGIDIGSHRTRACLRIPDTDTELVVQNHHYSGLRGSYNTSEFPSALYVFDSQSQVLYLPGQEDPSRQCVSAKYVFYCLADAKDELLEQYPPVDHLMKRKNEPGFRSQLRAGMVALLSALRDAATETCLDHGLRIAKVGLTIPVQWGLEFEDVYRGLITEVFPLDDPSQIYFFTETEALSRYLYRYHGRNLDPYNEHHAVLFFDFGGHNMNGCLFGVARDQDRPGGNGFFRIGNPFGAGGGSEQWEHHVAQWFSDHYFNDTGGSVPPHEREKLLLEFRTQKGLATNLRRAVDLTLFLPGSRRIWDTTLSVKTINKTWERALDGPRRTAQRELSRLTERVQLGEVFKPIVVVSGGTARNPAVREFMSSMCKEANVPVVFAGDYGFRIADDSAKVAKAAAYVVSEILTVAQYFERGAAIGLQMRQAPKQGRPKSEDRAWDDSATFLMDGDCHKEPSISVQGRDEFRLICDPFFGQLPLAQREGGIAANRAYDLFYLGRRKQGNWYFSLSLHLSGDEMELEIQEFYRQRRELAWCWRKTVRLPLYFDGNSSTIQVGDRSRDISELGLDIPPQPRHLEGMAATDLDGDGSDAALLNPENDHGATNGGGLGFDQVCNTGVVARISQELAAQAALGSLRRPYLIRTNPKKRQRED